MPIATAPMNKVMLDVVIKKIVSPMANAKNPIDNVKSFDKYLVTRGIWLAAITATIEIKAMKYPVSASL